MFFINIKFGLQECCSLLMINEYATELSVTFILAFTQTLHSFFAYKVSKLFIVGISSSC